jgi:thiamine biosynthesis lipoprotein
MGKKTSATSRREFLAGKAATKAIQDRVSTQLAAETAANSEVGSPLTPSAEVPSSSLLLHLSRRAMATEFEVYLNDHRNQEEMEASLAALDLLEPLEQLMSVYRESSDLSQLNRSAVAGPQLVAPELFSLLERGTEFYRWTGGAFDMTSTPLSRLWGFFHRQGAIPTDESIQSVLAGIGGAHVQFYNAPRRISFDAEGLELNLGAIGKGFALDQLAEFLIIEGVTSFLLHGGLSSVRSSGSRDGGCGWRIDLKHPLIPSRSLGEVLLDDEALGTSGCGNQYFYHRGRRYGHIIDPRSGCPADVAHSATVIAPDATTADAIATAFYVMGVEESRGVCAVHPELAAIFVVGSGKSGTTETLTIGDVGDRWRAAS